MRKEANTKSEIITNLYKDDKVEILEKDGIWYKIKYEGKVGYMRADLIDVTSGTVPNATTPEASTTQEKTPENTQQETSNPVQTTETNVTKKEYIVKLDTKIKTYPVIYSRDKEEIKKGEKIEKLEEEIAHRDFLDSTRKESPLKKADDAIEIDTTSLSIQEVVSEITNLIQEKMLN